MPISDAQLDEQVRDVLFHYLKKVKVTKEENVQASIAASTLATISRRQQTSGAREATALLYARELIEDPATRHEYLRLALPSSTFVKALPAAVKGVVDVASQQSVAKQGRA